MNENELTPAAIDALTEKVDQVYVELNTIAYELRTMNALFAALHWGDLPGAPWVAEVAANYVKEVGASIGQDAL